MWELVIIFAVLLLLFGARRLPEMGRSLGRGMREFKDSVTGKDKDELPAAESTDKPEPVRAEAAESSPAAESKS